MAFPMPSNTNSDSSTPLPAPAPTKDPALLLVEEIEMKLEDLKQMLGGSAEVEEPEEMEQQSDQEVAAGLPPVPKKKVPGGTGLGF